MNRFWPVAAAVCVGTCLLAGVYLFVTVKASGRDLDETRAYRDRLAAQVQQYRTLLAKSEDTLYGAQPDGDIEARLAETFQAAGFARKPAYSLTMQADREIRQQQGPPGLHERQVSIQVPNLSIHEIGDVLIHWRDRQAIWSPEQIEIIHDTRSREHTYTLKLNCVAVYHKNGAGR